MGLCIIVTLISRRMIAHGSCSKNQKVKRKLSMQIGAIIQARTSATRLPGKVLRELPYGSGITVLEQVIRRVKKTKLVDEVIVATTTNASDDQIVKIASKEKVKIFRGSESNVLSRYYLAAKESQLDHIVRITADCPCIDPCIIDQVIKKHCYDKNHLTTTILEKRTFPHGIEVEVFSFEALEKSYQNATDQSEKEHINLYIENNIKEFKVDVVKASSKLARPNIRVTLDTPEDYLLLCCIFDFLYAKNHSFSTQEIVDLFDAKPWLYKINDKVIQKKVFNSLQDEFEEAYRILKLQEFYNVANCVRKKLCELK